MYIYICSTHWFKWVTPLYITHFCTYTTKHTHVPLCSVGRATAVFGASERAANEPKTTLDNSHLLTLSSCCQQPGLCELPQRPRPKTRAGTWDRHYRCTHMLMHIHTQHNCAQRQAKVPENQPTEGDPGSASGAGFHNDWECKHLMRRWEWNKSIWPQLASDETEKATNEWRYTYSLLMHKSLCTICHIHCYLVTPRGATTCRNTLLVLLFVVPCSLIPLCVSPLKDVIYNQAGERRSHAVIAADTFFGHRCWEGLIISWNRDPDESLTWNVYVYFYTYLLKTWNVLPCKKYVCRWLH